MALIAYDNADAAAFEATRHPADDALGPALLGAGRHQPAPRPAQDSHRRTVNVRVLAVLAYLRGTV